MTSTSRGGFFSVLKGRLFQFKPLHEKGLSYTSINIARCAFSAILDQEVHERHFSLSVVPINLATIKPEMCT
ncbi:hypothetical protein P5673_018030 [Acropora cervicornis]|uniref:Uncharacterized protein n=1 Tax=Acropora cervicornis TaxID=6130 RepID=A0AAD9QDJ3_ACRCE|nr:hypothetical protein P5673_018030 [Acropora cervicornis]